MFAVEPYRFFFTAVDAGERPHAHVRRDQFVARFWLDPMALAKDGGLSVAEITRIQRTITRYQSRLLAEWTAFFAG